MAGSGFPERKSSGAGGMTSATSDQLDGPPPSPVMANANPQMQPGQGASQPMPSFGQMAQPLTAGTPGRATSPEIAMGIMQTAETIYGLLDSFASVAPDLANDFALQKDLLQRTMSKLLLNSGATSAAAASGVNFPGGGFGLGSR